MKTAVVTFRDDDIGKRVRSIMRRYGASLVDIKAYTDHTQLQFQLNAGTDVDLLNNALDAECGAHNFAGRICG